MIIPVAHDKVMDLTAEIVERRELIDKLRIEIQELEVIRANLVARIEELS